MDVSESQVEIPEEPCSVCGANVGLQGAVVKNEKNEEHVICGLHLSMDGNSVLQSDLHGFWEVARNWGFEYAPSREPLKHLGSEASLKLFDNLMERIGDPRSSATGLLQNSQQE